MVEFGRELVTFSKRHIRLFALLLVAVGCGGALTPLSAGAAGTGQFQVKEQGQLVVTSGKKKKKRNRSAHRSTSSRQSDDEPTSASKQADPLPTIAGDDQIAGRTELRAGPFTATIEQDSASQKLYAGTSAFATVRIRSDDQDAREAELVVEAIGGVVRGVTGPKVQTSRRKGVTTAQFRLGKDGTQTLLVEMAVQGGGTAPRPQSKLRLILRTSTGRLAADGSLLSWDVADCAGSFHSALAPILTDREALFKSALETARQEEAGVHGDWLFKPVSTKPQIRTETQVVDKRVCTKSERLYDEAARKRIKKCVAYESRKVETKVELPPDPNLDATVFSLANGFVIDRGAISALAKNGDYAWFSSRIISDLRIFLDQPLTPGLCSNLDSMFDYWTENARGMKRTIDAVMAAAESSRRLGTAKVEALPAAAGLAIPSTPTASNGLGIVTSAQAGTGSGITSIAPASAAETAVASNGDTSPMGGTAVSEGSGAMVSPVDTDTSPKALAARIARRILAPADAAAVASAPSAFTAIKMLYGAWRGGAADALPEDQRAKVKDALSMIEAAAYLEAARYRYGRVNDAIFGSMSTIKDAHDKQCTCQP